MDSDEDDGTENLFLNTEKNTQVVQKSKFNGCQSKITVSIRAGQGVLDVFPHARVSDEFKFRAILVRVLKKHAAYSRSYFAGSVDG